MLLLHCYFIEQNEGPTCRKTHIKPVILFWLEVQKCLTFVRGFYFWEKDRNYCDCHTELEILEHLTSKTWIILMLASMHWIASEKQFCFNLVFDFMHINLAVGWLKHNSCHSLSQICIFASQTVWNLQLQVWRHSKPGLQLLGEDTLF